MQVEVGGQSLTAIVHPGGAWGVSAQDLPAGRHTVVASITDAALNTGTAHQTLDIGPTGTTPTPTPTPTPHLHTHLRTHLHTHLHTHCDLHAHPRADADPHPGPGSAPAVR